MIFDDLLSFPAISLVFPESLPEVEPSLPLLRAEKAEFEAVFGIPVAFLDQDPGSGPRWTIEIDPDRQDNVLEWHRQRLLLVSRARDADGLGMTFNLLHSLVALGVESVSDRPHASMAEAVDRTRCEVAGSFPGFSIRNLNWEDLSSRHIATDVSGMTFEDMQRWIAGLGDAHTAIRKPVSVYNPPYAVELTPDSATIRRVREGSDAWKAGVRAGWRLGIDNPAAWLARTGAPPHAKSLTAGRRAIALDGVESRQFTATSPSGDSVSWTERGALPALGDVFSWRRLDERTAVMHLANWFTGLGLEEALDDALTELRGVDRLVLDLRGNTGGNLVLALETRRRFLRQRTLMGAIRFSRGDGTLADPVDLWDEPSIDRVRWEGGLIVLTDPLTYSASEDFLLGLHGLPHVTVIGQRSGGGSGRARTIHLLEDMTITISTALTYDRAGTCIENHGIPVDVETECFAENGRDTAMDRALESLHAP